MDRPRRRKLLVASLGIASVSYVVGVACVQSATSGNLPAPPPGDAAVRDATNDQNVTSGNLPAPPPPEDSGAGDAGDASDDATDASDDADGG